MKVYDMALEHDDHEGSTPDSGGGGGWIFLVILGVLFLPGILWGTLLYWVMLRILRQRISVTFTVVAIAIVTAIIGWNVTDSWGTIQYVFSSWGVFQSSWNDLIVPALWMNLVIGSLFGYVMVGLSLRAIRKNPDRLQLEGSWEYQFKFRRTPLQLLRRRRRIQGLKNGEYVAPGLSPLGIDEETEDRVAYRYGEEAAKHTLMSGTSGSGKTITLLSMALSDIINGEPVIVIDFKRSPELAGKLSAWAHEYGADFYHFVNGDPSTYDVQHSPGQSFYDPLSSGSPTAQADMVLGMREYDAASEVYKSNMQQLLQVLFQMIHHAKIKRSKLSGKALENFAPKIEWDQGGIYLVYSAVGSNEAFGQLVDACEGTPIQKEAEGIYEQIHGKTQISHAMGELTGQMRTIVASEYGRWMKTADPNRTIDLFKLSSQQKKVILFSLNSDDEAFFAQYVGSMIMADLTSVSAKRRNAGIKNKVNVYVDEFQAVNPDSVKGLLEKARESRIAMTLAQQSFEQIITAAGANGEAYLNAILGTCSNFIAHAGSTESTAERLSGILGKEWVTSYRRTNKNKSFIFSLNWANKRNQMVTTDRIEEWVYPPKKFMQLSMPDKNNNYRSTAVLINKSVSDPRYGNRDGGTARTVWMIPDNRVIASYYEPKMAEKDEEYLELVHENKILSAENTLESPGMQENSAPQDYPEPVYYDPDDYEYDDESAFVGTISEDDPELFEDADGGFNWETLDDDDTPTAASLGVSFDNTTPTSATPPRQETQRAPQPDAGLPQLDDLPEAPAERRVVRATKPAQQSNTTPRNGSRVTPSANGIPVRSSLPTKPPQNTPAPTSQEPAVERQAPQREASFSDYWNNSVKPETLQDVQHKQRNPVRSKPAAKKKAKDENELPDIGLPDL